MTGMLTTGATFLLGLAASGHCLAMCGGVTAALGLATVRDASGRVRVPLLLACQIGRIVSYSLAGLLVAGALGGVVAVLDVESVRRVLRLRRWRSSLPRSSRSGSSAIRAHASVMRSGGG